ncbi:MAG: hypothetical protein B7X08_04295 [Acidocella sp. 20-63-7]|nr:MAG: hypothetical protein B7X08_04295 [Acidocella sp. 20-63-7]HQT46672.1 RcnB family protein [Acidocella sp.]
MNPIYRNAASAGLALTLAAAPLAMAQQPWQPPQTDQHPTNPSHMAPDHAATMSINHPPEHAQGHEQHHWQRGGYYSGRRHVVRNWGYHHLSQPPHGYEWVQDGSQFVLITIASGVIAQVLVNAMSPH